MYLLDIMPLASWLGAATTLLIGIIGFFLKNAYAEMTKEIGELRKQIADLRTDTNTEVRKIEHTAHEYKLSVLEKLSEIKETINNARK